MKAKLYRGANEIGGTCLQLTASNGKVLWVDCGAPLDPSDKNVEYSKGTVDSVLISHPHQDHYGLIRNIRNGTPIYIGKVGLDLINAVPKFVNKVDELEGNFHCIKPWKKFNFLDTFEVTPFLTDHSTPESFSFLIVADSKRLFYSGDFRSTGRKGQLFNSMVDTPVKNIDILFIEGTMIQRENHKYPNEKSVENEIVNIIKNQKNTSFILSSAQNIDRFVSCYNACKRTGKYVVIDAYTAWLLEKVSEVSKSLPTVDWNEVKIYCPTSQIEKIKKDIIFYSKIKNNMVGKDAFINPARYLYFTRCPNSNFIKAIADSGTINVIYSQWKGYLQSNYEQWFTEYVNSLKSLSDIGGQGISFHFAHTSGHAVVEDLIKYSKAINAKITVPIHCEFPTIFKEKINESFLNKVNLWSDNIEYIV